MEEDEQDQEVPEAPSPVEEEGDEEEADNEQEVHMSILEEAIDNAVMGSSQNREATNSGEFEEAIIATEGRENEHMTSEVGRNTSEGANEGSTGFNEERGLAGREPKEQVEEGVSLVPEIEENGREEEEGVNVNQEESVEENA